MGSSAKKKKEKKQDFQKPKLKVGKARPKNTNSTDTNFTAKCTLRAAIARASLTDIAIVIKQSLSETGRDESALFNHNLSLLSSRNETQRRDALAFLTTYVSTHQDLPQASSTILNKALPLALDGNSAIRSQLLKLVRVLPAFGALDSPLLYIRAGLTHLSVDIRLSALDLLDWLIQARPDLVSLAGGWIKLLRTFQILLSWDDGGNKWSSKSMGSSKLVVHQMTSLTAILAAGLNEDDVPLTAPSFPLWHQTAHMLPTRSNVYGYLNLFGSPRDIDGEMYETAIERREIFVESGLRDAFLRGSDNAKKEGGEIGRAASGLVKVIKLTMTDE